MDIGEPNWLSARKPGQTVSPEQDRKHYRQPLALLSSTWLKGGLIQILGRNKVIIHHTYIYLPLLSICADICISFETCKNLVHLKAVCKIITALFLQRHVTAHFSSVLRAWHIRFHLISKQIYHYAEYVGKIKVLGLWKISGFCLYFLLYSNTINQIRLWLHAGKVVNKTAIAFAKMKSYKQWKELKMFRFFKFT